MKSKMYIIAIVVVALLESALAWLMVILGRDDLQIDRQFTTVHIWSAAALLAIMVWRMYEEILDRLAENRLSDRVTITIVDNKGDSNDNSSGS